MSNLKKIICTFGIAYKMVKYQKNRKKKSSYQGLAELKNNWAVKIFLMDVYMLADNVSTKDEVDRFAC